MALAGTAFALTTWPPLLLAGRAHRHRLHRRRRVRARSPRSNRPCCPTPRRPAIPTRLFGTLQHRRHADWLAGRAGRRPALRCRPRRPRAGCSSTRSLQCWRCRLPRACPPARGAGHEPASAARRSRESRSIVRRMAALFALDSFGGGFVVNAYIAYYLARRYGASPETLGVVFFAIGILQAASFQAAVRLAERIGLLRTMVFTAPAVEPPTGRGRLRPEPRRPRSRCCSAASALADGCPTPPGLRRRRRHPRRAHRRSRLHQQRPLRRPPGRPLLTGLLVQATSSAHRSSSPAPSRPATTSLSTAVPPRAPYKRAAHIAGISRYSVVILNITWDSRRVVSTTEPGDIDQAH